MADHRRRAQRHVGPGAQQLASAGVQAGRQGQAAPDALPLDPPGLTAAADVVQGGAQLYGRYCTVCHGDAAVQASGRGGIIPDLRYSGTLSSAENWQMIVHDGALKDNGMVSFAPVMSKPEIDSIRQYVIARANEDKALMTKKVAMK